MEERGHEAHSCRVVKTGNITSRPEHEALLCCLQASVNAETEGRLRDLVVANFDWKYLFQLARRHSVVPLTSARLQQYASDLIPTAELQRLKKHYQENTARNLILTAELVRIIELLANSGIEAVPYKGPALALFAYGDLALRRYVDLDIMVRKSDVLQARDLLIADGYRQTRELNLDQQQRLLQTQHNLQFSRSRHQLIVELHWEVASHFFASSVQADELWQNLVSIQLNGTRVQTLAAEDLLFSLCVHGSRHLWERLSWICDIAMIVERHQLDWPRLLQRAAANHNERMFLLGPHLAARLMGTQLPDTVVAETKADSRLNPLATEITERLFNGTIHIPASRREIFKYNFQVRQGWGSRARYGLFMLSPTDSDFSIVSLPQRLGFVYYLLRPFRLLLKEKAAGASAPPAYTSEDH